MDTWIGGMFEQQITMQACMVLSPSMSDGLTPEKIQEYMEMDLKKANQTDLRYVRSRKMSIDHRLGGNPELTDQKVCRQTICCKRKKGEKSIVQ